MCIREDLRMLANVQSCIYMITIIMCTAYSKFQYCTHVHTRLSRDCLQLSNIFSFKTSCLCIIYCLFRVSFNMPHLGGSDSTHDGNTERQNLYSAESSEEQAHGRQYSGERES